ncbi:MAG: hypothetical protein ACTS73_08750 [Arsenophonus sp. NEOnobi-MAG3]
MSEVSCSDEEAEKKIKKNCWHSTISYQSTGRYNKNDEADWNRRLQQSSYEADVRRTVVQKTTISMASKLLPSSQKG